MGTLCPEGPNWLETICPGGLNFRGPFVQGDRKWGGPFVQWDQMFGDRMWGTGCPGTICVRDQMRRSRIGVKIFIEQTHCLDLDLNDKRLGVNSDGNFSSYLIGSF